MVIILKESVVYYALFITHIAVTNRYLLVRYIYLLVFLVISLLSIGKKYA